MNDFFVFTAKVTEQIYQAEDLRDNFTAIVSQLRQMLQTDRVLLYCCGEGVVAKSVAPGFGSITAQELEKLYLGKNCPKTNLSRLDTTEGRQGEIELLEQFQVQSHLVVPILLPCEQLWGLLIVHHCIGHRQWQPEEIKLLKQLSQQIAIAIRNQQLQTQLQTEISQRLQIRQQAEEELQHFFTLSQDMFCIASFDGYFQQINPMWSKTLGYSTQELLNQPFLSLVHPEDRPSTLEQAKKLLQGIACISFENRYRCKDGSYRWLLWTATPLPQQKLVYGIARDITNRKQAEQQLQRMNNKLADSNQELEQFAYVVSHDLQEPLRKIKGYSDLLNRRYQGKLDQRADKYITNISDSVMRMQALIRDLLTYSRVSTSKPVFRPTDLAIILQQTLNDLSSIIKESNANIIAEPLPVINANPTQIRQLLQNLLSNAIKFRTQQTPQIHIYARREAQFWLIAVKDNGIGIDAQYAQRVFVIFQRLHYREDYPGTGIGLAICQKIVELHGGKIWFESTPGAGTTFFVRLKA